MSDFNKWEKEIAADQPITVANVNLYPITVEHYKDFFSCSDVLTLQVRSLKKARYVLQTWIKGIFAYSMDHPDEETLYFYKFMRIFFLSLRIGEDFSKFMRGVFFSRNEDGCELEKIIVVQNEKAIDIPLGDFKTIREALTLQNGLELPDEKANPELLESEKKRNEAANEGKYKIDPRFCDLLASVAYNSGLRERELYDWTVREFMARVRAIERDKRFMKYAVAEIAGAFKPEEGNPAPSWCFDAKDETCGTVDFGKMESLLTNLKN